MIAVAVDTIGNVYKQKKKDAYQIYLEG